MSKAGSLLPDLKLLQESTVVLKHVGDGRPVFLTFTGVEGLTSVLLLSDTVKLS